MQYGGSLPSIMNTLCN